MSIIRVRLLKSGEAIETLKTKKFRSVLKLTKTHHQKNLSVRRDHRRIAEIPADQTDLVLPPLVRADQCGMESRDKKPRRRRPAPGRIQGGNRLADHRGCRRSGCMPQTDSARVCPGLGQRAWCRAPLGQAQTSAPRLEWATECMLRAFPGSAADSWWALLTGRYR